METATKEKFMSLAKGQKKVEGDKGDVVQLL